MPTPSGHTNVIRAKKVLGTVVKDPAGQKIGHVEDVVLDKMSSNIVFAVVSFGGFLGIGEKYHPVPWGALNYVVDEDAYVIKSTRDQLAAAPFDTIDALLANDAHKYRESVEKYYGHGKRVTVKTKAPARKSTVAAKVAVKTGVTAKLPAPHRTGVTKKKTAPKSRAQA